MIEEADNFDKKLGRQAKINRDKQYSKKEKNDLPRPRRDPYRRERLNYEDFLDEDTPWEEQD